MQKAAGLFNKTLKTGKNEQGYPEMSLVKLYLSLTRSNFRGLVISVRRLSANYCTAIYGKTDAMDRKPKDIR